MKISDLVEKLNRLKDKHGDIEVVMQGTLLKDGFSVNNSEIMPDVFPSTVETLEFQETKCHGKSIRLYWQC